MVASKHTSRSAANGHRPAVRHSADGGLRSVEHLVAEADRLGLRAPELVHVLGERAAALAEAAGSNELWVRAESLVVHAQVRLGHRAPTVGRAVAALRAAEDAGLDVVAAQLRTDLAVCARSVGAPLTGLAALRPVLTVGGLSALQRAEALCHLVGCLGTLGRKAELDRVLMEGDRLVTAADGLDDDAILLARALIRVSVSGHRRRHGDLVGAADAARTGIGFLDHLGDQGVDGGLARVRLVLELVCALLDRGDTELALEIAEPVLAAPERAAGVAPAAWLRLAIATRVHLRDGAAETAARMLRDAVHSATRYDLHALAARLWLELAHVEERIGQPVEAIQCLHSARAAEHRHARARSQARALLTGEFGSGEQAPVDLADVVASASPSAPAALPAPPPEPRREPEPEPPRAVESRRERRPEPEPQETQSPRPSFAVATSPPAQPALESRPRVVLPMLRLAAEPEEPEPTDDAREPASHRQQAPWQEAEREPAYEPMAEAEPAPEAQREQEPEPEPEPAPAPRPEPEPLSWRAEERASRASTRHDSEHGSVAARSVLDRLGISPGSGGGRRRAAESDEGGRREERPRAPEFGAVEPGAGSPATTESAPPASRHDDETGMSSDGYGWLPKLRLPPSLAPLEDLASDHSSSFEPSSSAPEPDPVHHDLPSDEPPADAGLAELLARALAEHQAGTSSASALVKQLGVDHDEPAGSHTVNGRNRNDV
ncbi:hypothetical protein [Prauserella muralis]|uniref:Uncharacterized protein n=1 Tax=Prauserella muralis TaxID=588067 RepID=A0A2V4B2T2_9PSEU|nr:hypothetical protein [Prauserella muralis]PXY27455.1 hypothetical protein BAY60_13575 [Prauserella muralis]TWE22842.1 hypothetical protein FHX69_4096 [Prauserella muralis]